MELDEQPIFIVQPEIEIDLSYVIIYKKEVLNPLADFSPFICHLYSSAYLKLENIGVYSPELSVRI